MRPSAALEANRAALRQLIARYGMLHPRVFGSVLTVKDTEDSDLDLLIDSPISTTLLRLAALQNAAEDSLGVPVSVLTPEDLPVEFRGQVLEQAQPL